MDATERAAQIEALIAGLRAHVAAGERLDRAALIAANSDLMPELEVELRLLAVSLPRDAETTVPPSNATAPTIDEAFRPVIGVPGYTLLRELSRGGQGVVFLATQLSTKRKVAVKVMRDGPLADHSAMGRFKREVEALAALNHPNIVNIIDTGNTLDGSQFISMNYIAGQSLDEYMAYRRQRDGDDPSKLLRMFINICAAVHAAHLRGIVHRDLKPSNIRIDEHGQPHILDFGLARTSMDAFIRTGDRPISITGEFLGSLPWASPEQAEGDSDAIDVRSDVYSLGVILYQMLTGGHFPYEVAGSMRDILNNIMTAEPTPPSKMIAALTARREVDQRQLPTHHTSAVNEGVERIVLKSLNKRRQDRYQTAGELAKDVVRYLAGQRTVASIPTKPVTRSPLHHPAVWALGGVAAMVVIAGSLWLVGLFSGEKRATANVGAAPEANLVSAATTQIAMTAASSATTQISAAAILPSASAPGIMATSAAQPAGTQVTEPAVIPPASAPRVVDLMRLVDVNNIKEIGTKWNWRDQTLVNEGEPPGSFLFFPYAPPLEYDFRVTFKRTNVATNFLSFGLIGAGRPFAFGIGNGTANFRTFTTVEASDGHRVVGHWLVPDRELTFVAKVRRGRTDILIDGKTIDWIETNYQELKAARWNVGCNVLAFSSLSAGNDVIIRAEVTEISGPGRLVHEAAPAFASPASTTNVATRSSATTLPDPINRSSARPAGAGLGESVDGAEQRR